jgi:hypothetical protein
MQTDCIPTRLTPPGGAANWLHSRQISRPQWRRDTLDGLLDYHVVGSAMRTYPRLVFERKRSLGEIVLEYGSTNPVEGSNVQPAGWCLDVWSLGGDAVVPWQTIGDAGSWDRADELSLFYPGRGRAAVPPPITASSSIFARHDEIPTAYRRRMSGHAAPIEEAFSRSPFGTNQLPKPGRWLGSECDRQVRPERHEQVVPLSRG